jgi:NADP-dependent 3-hydroxy acid dehydrogenase YdfG
LAVVTGAASGIGSPLAERLAAVGARLILADVDAVRVRGVAERLGATPQPTDVADPGEARLADSAADASLICLNAGVASTFPGPVWEAPAEEWERVLAINLGGVVNGLRAFVPGLLRSGQPASILITASLAGLATWAGGGPYAASKHAVVAVAEQASLSLAGSKVNITLLCPALVRSGMSPEGQDPLAVAEAALAAVAQRRFAVVPEAWRNAVRLRGERLADGLSPVLPEPSVD